MKMRKLTINEVKDRKEKLELAPLFMDKVCSGVYELFEYTTIEEMNILLNKPWSYHNSDEKTVSLRNV